jgi:hypothetical protein
MKTGRGATHDARLQAQRHDHLVRRAEHRQTQNQLKRRVFQDLEQLITAIENYIGRHNLNPQPFIWTAKASDMLEKVTRAQSAINKRRSA